MTDAAINDTTRPALPNRATYEGDFYTWAEEQAALLRAGRLDEIDVENIAEELRDVGSSEVDQLWSSLRVLLMHILNWDRSPAFRTRSWAASIAEQRRRIARTLGRNPGLRPRFDELREDAYESARRWSACELNLIEEDFPHDCPYGWADLIERPFGDG